LHRYLHVLQRARKSPFLIGKFSMAARYALGDIPLSETHIPYCEKSVVQGTIASFRFKE
jgi:hypothetical protein